MTEDQERRLELGKRADKLGWILSLVGTRYQLRSNDDSEDEYSSDNLDGIEARLTQLEG